MIAADTHVFVKTRSDKAKCACGWVGKFTTDKNKSWKAHVRRVES